MKCVLGDVDLIAQDHGYTSSRPRKRDWKRAILISDRDVRSTELAIRLTGMSSGERVPILSTSNLARARSGRAPRVKRRWRDADLPLGSRQGRSHRAPSRRPLGAVPGVGRAAVHLVECPLLLLGQANSHGPLSLNPGGVAHCAGRPKERAARRWAIRVTRRRSVHARLLSQVGSPFPATGLTREKRPGRGGEVRPWGTVMEVWAGRQSANISGLGLG